MKRCIRFGLKGVLFGAVFLSYFQGNSAVAQTVKTSDIIENNYSYGKNVDISKALYEEEKKEFIKATHRFPKPWILKKGEAFYKDIRSIQPIYFGILALSSFLLFVILQFIVARMLDQKHAWITFSWFIAGFIWYIDHTGYQNIIAARLLVGVFAIPPLWQLFRIAHVDFLKTVLLQVLLLAGIYGALVTKSDMAVRFLSIIWTVATAIVYVNVFSNIAFKCARSSWVGFNTFIPLIGFPLYFLACVKSLMEQRRVNPVFVNVILALLEKNMSKITIRQKALSAKVRLEYFERHYNYAIQKFKDNIFRISKTSYLARFLVIKILFFVAIVLAFGQILLGGMKLYDYYMVYQTDATDQLFYNALEEDNVTALKKALDGGVSIYKDCNGKEIKSCDPVYTAVYNDSIRVLPVLLQAGAVTNIKDENDWTPLIYATRQKKDEQMITLLLEE